MAFIRELMAITPYVALDSQTFGANEIVALKPWLIKPNSEEIEALVGHPCHGLEALLEAADSLFQGGIAHVFVSLGGDGAIYCGEFGKYRIDVPTIKPLSTIGAGDSTLAGFLSAYADGLDGIACLTRACAFGTAACLEAGTNPPLPDKVASISKQIRVTAL
jgi:fructose-1-phosphate kinase PfkB-like protein